MAVAVEDLNSGRVVNDIEVVLGIDGRGSRLDKIAVLDAALPPNQLRLGLRSATAAGKEPQKAPREAQEGISAIANPRHRESSTTSTGLRDGSRLSLASSFDNNPMKALAEIACKLDRRAGRVFEAHHNRGQFGVLW
jgi:hypothetical protein